MCNVANRSGHLHSAIICEYVAAVCAFELKENNHGTSFPAAPASAPPSTTFG
jgi:hypothetical protein